MGFVEAVKTCMTRKYASFEGRASRSEYWYFMLFCMLLSIIPYGVVFAMISSNQIGRLDGMTWGLLTPFVVLLLVIFLPTLSVTVRRLHDRDMSGWWYLGFMLLSAIPVVGFLVAIYWFVINCMRGTVGPNRFGRDPLGATHSADVFA